MVASTKCFRQLEYIFKTPRNFGFSGLLHSVPLFLPLFNSTPVNVLKTIKTYLFFVFLRMSFMSILVEVL